MGKDAYLIFFFPFLLFYFEGRAVFLDLVLSFAEHVAPLPWYSMN